METRKVVMKVSIASADWSYVPQEEAELEADLAAKWVEVGHAAYVNEETDKTELAEGIISLGAGWFSLPNGQKVQGKKKALEALEANQAAPEEPAAGGDVNGLETDNGTDSGALEPTGSEGASEG